MFYSTRPFQVTNMRRNPMQFSTEEFHMQTILNGHNPVNLVCVRACVYVYL